MATHSSDIRFPVFESLKRGGLSLWLNRRALLPLSAMPLGIAFLTLTLIRGFAPKNMSEFTLALFQIPADMAIGMFCALVILIISYAPKKTDAKPVMFTVNVIDKKRLLLAGAIAHTIFSYLFLGVFALIGILTQPIEEAQKATGDAAMPDPQWGLVALSLVVFLFALYAVRFALLPVLVVSGRAIGAFFRQYKAFYLSFPVILIMLLTSLAVSFVLFIPVSIFPETDPALVTPVQAVVIDLCAAVAKLAAHAWSYAALAVGVRIMTEK